VRACLDLLRNRGSVAVVGPSGSGKSSLVRAGVAAALRRDGLAVLIITPGEHPMQSLSAESDAVPGSVLLVDQCEEAFSLCTDATERRDFFAGLVRWTDRGRLVLAMRADRLAEISAYPEFARLIERALHLLGAMSEQGLKDAVEAPARQAGLLVEPGLVNLLVGEVEGIPGALPLLSHALLETWKRRCEQFATIGLQKIYCPSVTNRRVTADDCKATPAAACIGARFSPTSAWVSPAWHSARCFIATASQTKQPAGRRRTACPISRRKPRASSGSS